MVTPGSRRSFSTVFVAISLMTSAERGVNGEVDGRMGGPGPAKRTFWSLPDAYDVSTCINS